MRRDLLKRVRWLVLFGSIQFVGCPCNDEDPCGDLCACMDDYFEANPDADEGFTVCKQQCEAQATDHNSCVDFVGGRTTPEHSEQLQMECASKSCHKLDDDEPTSEE